MEWNTVAAKICEDDRGKWDRKVPAREIRIGEDGKLEAMNAGPVSDAFTLSELATSQFCERLSVPTSYYRRLPTEMKATVANFDLKRLCDRNFLIRGKTGHIRAFLSGEYVAYDNAQIAEVTEGLLRTGDVTMKAFVLEETHCFLKLVSEDLVDPTSGLKAGIMIGNSEVGVASVSVEPFVFRKACTNDLVVTDDQAFRHAHIHLTANELSRRMAEAIANTFRVACDILDTFLRTKNDPIPDPISLIRKLAEERKLAQRFTDEVVGRYIAEPEPNRFGLINAFTGAAQTLAPLQRIDMERFAGSLLTTRL